MPKTILLTCGEYPASRLLTDPATASRVIGLDLYDLEHAGLEGYSGLLVPIHADQRFLMTVQDKLELFLAAGGTMVICGHLIYPFLPELASFVPLSARSVEDYRVWRMLEHPIFAGVSVDDLTFRKGIAGFYGRGHNPPPPYAQVLHRLGGPQGAPVDYCYHRPTGGRVLVHAGNTLWGIAVDGEVTSARRIETQLLDWIECPADTQSEEP
jgi:hypothetical protein